MEKKSLNKKLQLNKETIAILDKEQQSQILGGEIPTKTCTTLDTLYKTCNPPATEYACDTVAPITQNDCLTRYC